MRQYSIYLMKEEITERYYGREAKIFQLFLDEHRAKGRRKEIIRRQIEFVTRTILPLDMEHLFIDKRHHSPQTYIQTVKKRSIVEKKNSKAELVVHGTHLTICAEGNYEAETILFDVLSKYDPCFFALDLINFRYGWLYPIRKMKLI